MKKQIINLIICLMLISIKTQSQQILISEDFESGILNPLVTVQTVGSYNSAPGIKSNTNFGSTKAFGFGISTCPGSCFYNYTTSLLITFLTPTFVDSIKWSEMELYGNLGSWGPLYYDTTQVASLDFGAMPTNSGIADSIPRYQAYAINQTITTIKFYVIDITNLSEIVIDDLIITGNTTGINETTSQSISAISPNPSEGNFVITFERTIMKGNVVVLNILGEDMFTENIFNESKKEINLKNISNGIYFVKVFDGTRSYCKKLIID